MVIRFDSLNRFEVPKIFVCSPGCTYSAQSGLLSSVSGILTNTQDEELVARFNEESELNFRIPLVKLDDEDENAAFKSLYRSLKNRRVLFVENIGFFIITDVKDGFDGDKHYKDVCAHSCEVEIENKALPFIADGTYQFRDLLEDVVAVLPLWTIGHIDTAVSEKYRTFEDVSTDLNCLGFMQQDMQDAYECIFIYDITNRIINVYDQNDYVRDTYIHITEDDLVKTMEVSENSDDLYTALTVQGDEELNISPVNPLGANTIYNFDYYLDWMSPALSQKVAAWQQAVASQADSTPGSYYDLNLSYYTNLEGKSNTQAEIDAISTQLTMYRRCRENIVAEYGTSQVAGYNDVIVNSGGIPITIYDGIDQTIAGIDDLITAAESELSSQEATMETIDATLASLSTQIDTIRQSVSITSYFTQSELDELNNYIFEGQYTDEYITVTDQMGYDEKFQQMKTLYDRSVTQLERISKPTQEYSIDIENFIFIKDFEEWSSQLETGCLINVELEDDDVAMLFLTEFTVNYDDESLSMTFGNRFTKFSPKSLFDDVLGSVRKSANTLDYIKEILYPIKNGEFNQMKEALENSRNLTKDAVMSSSGETVLIDDTGYTGRRKLPNGSYDPKQIKINGRNIVFTDDAWETAITAIGEIILADSTTTYGINAQTVLGDLIVGNQLRILNSDGNDMFVVTEERVGASLENTILDITDGKISTAISDYNEGVQTQINANADSVNILFSDLSSLKANVESSTEDINGSISEINSYIKAVDGSIILGKSDSEYTLKIDHDRISICSNGTEITYWTSQDFVSPKSLVVPVGGKFTLGSFAFIPRDSGSLDFTWVGD